MDNKLSKTVPRILGLSFAIATIAFASEPNPVNRGNASGGVSAAHIGGPATSQFLSVCELWKSTTLVVEGDVAAWGKPETLRFSNYPDSYTLTPVTINVHRALKGHADSRMVVWIRLQPDEQGNTLEGNIRNGSGYFFLFQRDGKWLLSSQGFFRSDETGTLKNPYGFKSGLNPDEFLKQLPQCADK